MQPKSSEKNLGLIPWIANPRRLNPACLVFRLVVQSKTSKSALSYVVKTVRGKSRVVCKHLGLFFFTNFL
jgi:hypothetical protein